MTAWWRRARAWLLICLIVVLAAIVIGVLYRPPGNSYLDPGSTGVNGSHALADVLTGLGHQVTTVTSTASAVAAASAGTTLVITSPADLTRPDLGALARVPASVLLVEPDQAALAALGSGLRVDLQGVPVASTPAACTLQAAVLAGTADLGGTTITVPGRLAGGIQQCYPVGGHPSLVRLTLRERVVTILGTGAPLTNGALASQGNAALAIDLLLSHRIVWLVPPVAAVAAAAGPATPRSFYSLVPLGAYLVAIQLAVALLLAAAWRARRLGPLVAEPLPVVVRAAETVEGHARMYQSRRARARAAGALRQGVISRLSPLTGLPVTANRDAVVAALAPRSALTEARVAELLYGSAPASDRSLVELARDLDTFEREVDMS
ncbi:MAG TPA: DUF4350 domain-containing protein [Streptosporangiaceae bacterium]|nr:DUF4350 domain-containing protein [Streptosporangiaceae bacterium]